MERDPQTPNETAAIPPGYTLIAVLTSATTGKTALVMDQNTGQKLVIKTMMKRGKAASDSLFRREIAIISHLVHPHIVTVLDCGESTDYYYLIMEYMAGGTLADSLGKGRRYSVPEALAIGITLCQVLVFLEQKRVVHRDIKPSNLFISAQRLIKLGDFGLAKDITLSGKSGITTPGAGRGTLEYMPLEQLENAVKADHRSDIYSLGATLYHLLAGHPPHTGQTMNELLTDILTRTPDPIRTINTSVPGMFSDILSTMLAKRPEDRYQNPQRLLYELYQQQSRLEL